MIEFFVGAAYMPPAFYINGRTDVYQRRVFIYTARRGRCALRTRGFSVGTPYMVSVSAVADGGLRIPPVFLVDKAGVMSVKWEQGRRVNYANQYGNELYAEKCVI